MDVRRCRRLGAAAPQAACRPGLAGLRPEVWTSADQPAQSALAGSVVFAGAKAGLGHTLVWLNWAVLYICRVVACPFGKPVCTFPGHALSAQSRCCASAVL